MTRAFSTHRQQVTMTMDFIKLLDSHLQGYPSMITMTFTVGMASTIAKKVEPKQTADDCEWWYFFFEGKLLPMNEDPQHLHLSLPCLNRSMDSNEWWVQTCYEQHFACEIQQQLIQLLLIHCRCFCFFLCNYIGANTFLLFSLNYYSYAMHTSTLHCFATYSKPLFSLMLSNLCSIIIYTRKIEIARAWSGHRITTIICSSFRSRKGCNEVVRPKVTIKLILILFTWEFLTYLKTTTCCTCRNFT